MKSFLDKNFRTTTGIGSILCLIAFCYYLYSLIMKGRASGDVAYELSNLWVVTPFLFCGLVGMFRFRNQSTTDWTISLTYLLLSLTCIFFLSVLFFSDNALGNGLVILLVILPPVCLFSIYLITKLFSKK